MGGENDRVVPRMELATDARAPACLGAGKGLRIHHLWLGSGVLTGAQGTCASPGLGRCLGGLQTPLPCDCCHIDMLWGGIDGNS